MRPNGNDLVLGTLANGRPLWLSREQRGKHQYIVGATGTGKSKLMEYQIRQDILNWPKSHSGLIVLDKHGALFDSLMGWIAAKRLRHFPIVPIDLRRNDWIVSYNVLRRRPVGDPAVIVGALARAIVHAWGQGNMDETPRLAKWLPTILGTLYEQSHTLADALYLLASPELRRAMTADVKSFAARHVWAMSATLRPGEFHEEVASTLNRLLRFLNNQTMRATLCQTEASFDLGQALEQGSLVLVSLATAGTQIDAEDARTFGSMLLSDLWTAAQSRGKRDEGAGGLKPFYCYVDEFQEYVTPVMAEALDQARGFGLHMTLAQQFPSQLSGRGELGTLLFNSVMANTRTKVVFQLDHPEDLATLALWLGRNAIDLDEIKHQHYSTKVLNHQLVYLPSHGSGSTQSEGENWQDSHAEGVNHTHTAQWSHTDAAGSSRGRSSGHSETYQDVDDPDEVPVTSMAEGESNSLSEQHSGTYGESDAFGTSSVDAQASGGSCSLARSQTTTWSPVLMPIMGEEASAPQFRSLEEHVFRFTQMLSGQRDRHAVVRLAGERCPVPIDIPPVTNPRSPAWYVKDRTTAFLGGLPFALPMGEAIKRMEHHEATFPSRALARASAAEPVSLKRKIGGVKVLPLPRSETVPASVPTSASKP